MSNFFRIDDLSVNTHPERFREMVRLLRERFPNCRIMGAVSPCVHDLTADERVFPAAWNRESDCRVFYKVRKMGVPEMLMHLCDEIAAHGMAHVDHRLLPQSAQELSIVMSCSLVGSKVFCPPFHKFDRATEQVCSDHGIKLIKFHDKMTHLKFEKVSPERDYYYFHTHDFATMNDFRGQIGA